MDENMLNIMYKASLEFGLNWRRPLKELAGERLPDLEEPGLSEICTYIAQVRSDIEKLMLDNYTDINDGSVDPDKIFDEIRARYKWMNESNVSHGYSQGMYYAWRS